MTMKWTATVGILALFCGASSGTIADPIGPNFFNITHYGAHFDHWSRCSDPRAELEQRIDNCKSLLGRGRGAVDDDVQIWIQIGDAYVSAHNYPAAENAFESAMRADGKDENKLDARARRREILAVMGRYEDAIADADDLLKAFPDEAGAYNSRCWIRAIAGKELDLAIADCGEALRRLPNNATFLDSRGLAEFKLGKLKDAAADYDAALDKEPKLASSLFMRGVIKLKNGDSAGGNADIKAAKNQNPLIADTFTAYGVTP